MLDDKARKALAKELEATSARVHRIQEQARRRIGDDRDAEQWMTLVMLRFDNVAVAADKSATEGPRRRATPRSTSRARRR